jgi:Kef-type K+ transport system membrane component KefB
VLAYVAMVIKQPLLLAYIGAGVLIGPLGLKLVHDKDTISILSELGLAFLLFIVGLEIDLKKLIASGKVASVVTVVQVAGCGAIGLLGGRLLGYVGLEAAYIGAAFAFSSTMIVVKLLADRSELDTVPGQSTLSILLVQDALAIVVLAVQPNLGGGSGGGSALATMGLSLVNGVLLVGGSLLLSRFVLPRVFRYAALTPEVMLISAITWCFLVSFAAMKAGFSVAMGALIAGVSISTFPYSLDVVAKIRPLRDFFVTIFLVSLGMLLTRPTTALVVHAIILSLLVIVSRFVTIWPMLRAFKYDNRVGVLSSIHLAQISEFALVIVLAGIGFKHIGQDLVSLVVLVLVITSTLSTYMIQFSHKLAAFVVRMSKGTLLEDQQNQDTRRHKRPSAPILLVGCFRVGSSLINDLHAKGKRFAVIDFSPKVHAKLQEMGIHCTYGDISHMDTLEHAGVHEAEILVCSISDDFLRGTDNKKMLEACKKLNPHARVFVTADSIVRAIELYEAGADYVVLPRVLCADKLTEIIEKVGSGGVEEVRAAELQALRNRVEVVA